MQVLKNYDCSELEKLLIKDGLLIPVAYEKLKRFPQEQLSVFCLKNGFYQLPTIELIDFLKEEIKGLKTIEIGAGNGSIGRALKIPLTDSCLQEKPEIKAFYLMMQQAPIKYPKDIIPIDGNEAVKLLKPECVIASWLTDYRNGNAYGIDEIKIIKSVKKYIHIGNEKTHGFKLALKKFKNRRFTFDWLISRSMEKNLNIIYIFYNE